MTRAQGLFEGPAPRLRAIPASAPFLDVLADAMIAALPPSKNPFALSDALVLLPNRRAARGLVDAFARRLGGAALLPAIRPLGDPHADDDPDVWGVDPIDTGIAPPIDRTRRRLELAALIRAREAAEHGVEDPARAIAMADELARLLDSAATVDRVAWEKLPTLVEDIDLAKHWSSSANFLRIVVTHWPEHLRELGLSDPAAHGAALRRALAQKWTREQPTKPIIIAGSTGSIATTRELMRVVSQLPRGVVVLPGIDVGLDEESWRLIGDQHPQFALKGTLEALGVAAKDIQPLQEETSTGKARRELVREALAPAEQTADWLARLQAAGGAAFVQAGAQGLRLIEAATENEEAAAIALLLREALENSVDAAVVTPDAALARRIESKLARWGIRPSVSHGARLRETDAGRLIALLCELARDPGEQVALAALMKHPRVQLARDRGALEALERTALRGPRCYQTLAELAQLEGLQKFARARDLATKLEQALAPMTALMSHQEATLAEFADSLTQSAELLCGAEAWRGADGERAAELLRDAIAYGRALKPMPSHAAPRVLMRLMDDRTVPPPAGGDPRIAIWGVLEARLQRRGLMILAGLNEGIWPAPAGEDPFLSRAMRAQLGLPSLDQRIGLAAHDFAQLASAPNVVLSRALRREGSPTVASRWLWRLKTLMQGAKTDIAAAEDHLAWAKLLDQPARISTAKPPRPCPPAGSRLTRLSVTQVETLIRDPYAIYARRILGLDYLQPVGMEPGYAERGTAIHRAVERFGDGDDPALLIRLFDEELRRAGVPPERCEAERARLKATVDALIAWFAERRALGVDVYREMEGVIDVDGVTLRCRADRIEIGPRHAAIFDFKTGQPPSTKQVESGLSPQLPLEAAMLARGAFDGVPKSEPTELVYWRLGNAEPTPKPLDVNAAAEAEKAFASLKALLARYAQPTQPFLSKPRVQFIKPYDEYDQLARRKEWGEEEIEE